MENSPDRTNRCPACGRTNLPGAARCQQCGRAIRKRGRVWFWVGAVFLAISALTWLLIIVVIAGEPADAGNDILGGVVLTVIPIGIGAFGVWRGWESRPTTLLQRGEGSGGVWFWVGACLLSISAVVWLPLILVIADEPADAGSNIVGGVLLTAIPMGIGAYGVWRGWKSESAIRLRSLWTKIHVQGTLALLAAGGMIAVGAFFAATMEAPGELVALAYATVVPGILAASVGLTWIIHRRAQPGPLLAGIVMNDLVLQGTAFAVLGIFAGGVAIGGWGWPVNVWLDIYSPDTVIRALVDEKEVEHHEHCGGHGGCSEEDHYSIHAGGRKWGVGESTYEVIQRGERVEIGFRPHTKAVSYIAYNLAEGDKIRVSVGLAPSERKVFEDAILPEFKRSTGLSVELVQIESGELLDLLREEAGGAGVIFDLLVIDNNSLAPLVAEGLVEDLTGETRRVPEEVLDSMLPVTQFGGRTFFFPFRPNVQVTFYNSEKFEEIGIGPPRTWDELLNSARTMEEVAGKGRLALKGVVGGPNAVQVTEFIWQAGGDPLVLNDKGSLRAFEFLQELAPYLSDRTPDAKFDTMNEHLASGDVYLGQNWAFGVQEIVVKNGKREIQAYSGWSGPEDKVHVLGGDVLAVPKGTANSTDALVFAEYLMSKDVQSTLAAEVAWPSIRDDAYDGVDPELKPYWDAINEAMSKTQARPNVPYWPEVEQILGQAWNDIVMNGRDVGQRLNFYATEIGKARQAASQR